MASLSLRLLGLPVALVAISGCVHEQIVAPENIDPSIEARFAVKPNTARARNVILFVGDGMGVSTVTGARIYTGQQAGRTGEEYVLGFERFPHLALIKTYNTNQQVPDSAGTATAMVTGTKTKAGVISVAPNVLRGDCENVVGNKLTSIAAQAKKAGKATGVVTNTRITHATPATLYAHASERDHESDAYMTAEQRAVCPDIAKQLLDLGPAEGLDVALGGGRGEFVGANLGGIRFGADTDLLTAWLSSAPNRVLVETAEALAELDTTTTPGQVLGLFARSHLRYALERKPGTTEPTLAAMTTKALELLSAKPNGYFLMVEGGRIDHGHHIGRAGVAFEEAKEFAEAIDATLAMVDLNETLVLVTADHSHTLTLAGYPTRGNPILGLVVGNDTSGRPAAAPKLAADGQPYTSVGYANGPGYVEGPRPAPEVGPNALVQSLIRTQGLDRDGERIWDSETHGGEDVALYATGPWSHLVGGVLEQQAIYYIMQYAFGWTN